MWLFLLRGAFSLWADLCLSGPAGWPLPAQLSCLAPGLTFLLNRFCTHLCSSSIHLSCFLSLTISRLDSLSSYIAKRPCSFRLALICLYSSRICIILRRWGHLSLCTYSHWLLHPHLTPCWTCPLGRTKPTQASYLTCIPDFSASSVTLSW